MTLSRPLAADCKGGNAEDARSTNCSTGIRTEGRGALTKRLLNALQNENSPQPEDIGDSEDIRVVVNDNVLMNSDTLALIGSVSHDLALCASEINVAH